MTTWAKASALLASVSLLVAMAAGCAAPRLPIQAPPSVSPITMSKSEWREVDQVLVLLDASGTMYAEETFPQAKALSQGFVAALPDKNQPARNRNVYNVGSIGYGGNDRVTSMLAPFDRARVAAAVDAVEIMGEVDGRGGHTPIDEVLDEAGAQLAGQSGLSALVLFSDGRPNDTDMALDSARALAESYRNVCFHTVHVGDDPEGAAFMTALSGVTQCGFARKASDVSSASSLSSFVRDVVAGAAPAPECPTLRLQGVNFAFDSDQIDAVSEVILDAARDALNQSACRNVRVSVEGHTDSIGPEEYNQGLSERRARAVKDGLVARGVSRDRLRSVGFGETRPIAPNQVDGRDNPDGRAMNRRVELRPLQ